MALVTWPFALRAVFFGAGEFFLVAKGASETLVSLGLEVKGRPGSRLIGCSAEVSLGVARLSLSRRARVMSATFEPFYAMKQGKVGPKGGKHDG